MERPSKNTKCLSLDISTKTGYSVLYQNGVNNEIALHSFGVKKIFKKIDQYGEYPWSYLYAAADAVKDITKIILDTKPDVIVIEETNLGKNRYSQKILEFLHNTLLRELEYNRKRGSAPSVFYLSSSEWRKALKLKLSDTDRFNNKLLKNAKSAAKESNSKVDKKILGIKGSINKKHLSVRFVNSRYNLNLKIKDNDVADSICIGTAFLEGARVCDGKI